MQLLFNLIEKVPGFINICKIKTSIASLHKKRGGNKLCHNSFSALVIVQLMEVNKRTVVGEWSPFKAT